MNIYQIHHYLDSSQFTCVASRLGDSSGHQDGGSNDEGPHGVGDLGDGGRLGHHMLGPEQ